KQKLTTITAGLVCLFGSIAAQAQFSSGSNGSYGALNPTSSTNLDMPPDGIFHCTTVNIPAGVTVGFNRNALNTPVYLLAQSNVVISGAITVEGYPGGNGPGQGGPGGFDGGFPAIQGYPPSDGQGPGGGKAG